VNLSVVRKEFDKGATDPQLIFSDKSVEGVVRAWAVLREKGTESLLPKFFVKCKRRLCTTAGQRKPFNK
jgi:hypothetical protein